MNRSTIYEFLRKETELVYSTLEINKRKYMIFIVPYKWDHSYLLINGMRFTDFQSVILFSSELVVRFDKFIDQQVNIPYKDIEYLEVREDMDIGYMALHNGNTVER